MKETILILSILFSVQCFGQKWYLNNVDKSEKYPYEYWFQFDNLYDTCTYELTKKSGVQNSLIELHNNQGDTVIFANIRIQNIETDSVTTVISGINGQTKIRLDKGKYKVEISAMNYDKFNLEFEVNNEQYLELKINLGLALELTVYQIDSKSELNEMEIIKIIECVKSNRKDFYENCSENKKYRVLMHI
jgi:hypothetical protein